MHKITLTKSSNVVSTLGINTSLRCNNLDCLDEPPEELPSWLSLALL